MFILEWWQTGLFVHPQISHSFIFIFLWWWRLRWSLIINWIKKKTLNKFKKVYFRKEVLYLFATIYIYIYIYIYTNLISTSIHGYQKKRKNPPPGTRDKNRNISNHRPRGKRKNIIGQKERTNPVTPVEKNQEICSQLVKRKLKPSVNTAMLQLQECSTRVEPIIKLT